MGNKAWKIIKIILILIIVTVIGLTAFYFIRGSEGEITGEDYLKVQEKYMAEFQVYSDNIDDIVSLYLDGSITEEDFLNHLEIFQQELDLMKATHDSEAEKYPVKTGTDTYHTKRGAEAVAECYDIYQNILTTLQNNSSDKDALSYKYIAYHQDIIHALSDYMTARDATFGTDEEE